MLPLRTIALVVALGAGALLYPLVAPSAQPGGVDTARRALGAGDYANAIALYTNVLQSERLDTTLLAAVYQERGVARHKSGSPITAIADYTNSIWLGVLPDSLLARSFLDRGIAYVEVGELIRARRDFDNAIGKDPHLADAYFGRATVNRLFGRAQDALADYDEALRLGHEQPHLVFFGRGLTQEMLGERGRAVADFTEAALRAPSSAPVRAKLAALGAPPPSDQEVQAFALNASRKMPERREAVPPAASIALADAGEILTLASAATEEPTGAIPASGPPTILRSAQPLSPGGKPGFLRPSQDTLLAEQAVAANLRAGESAPALGPADVADAEAPTGAIPTAPPAASPPPSASPVETVKTEPVKPDPQSGQAPPPAQPSETAAPQTQVPQTQAPTPPPAPVKMAAAIPASPAGQQGPHDAAGFFVQLGAYTDRAIADRGAASFKARFPAIATQHEAAVEPAKIAGRGTIYRVRLGPLGSEQESRTLCESLRKSAQACVPVIPPKSLR